MENFACQVPSFWRVPPHHWCRALVTLSVLQIPLLADAIAMATVNPGHFVGNRGQLTLGSRADVVRFWWKDEIVIENVWLAGEHCNQGVSAKWKQ